MDYKTKNHAERLIKQRIHDLVTNAYREYKDYGPLQGTMIFLAINEFKNELLSDPSTMCNSIGASKEYITDWIEELFKEETKKYILL